MWNDGFDTFYDCFIFHEENFSYQKIVCFWNCILRKALIVYKQTGGGGERRELSFQPYFCWPLVALEAKLIWFRGLENTLRLKSGCVAPHEQWGCCHQHWQIAPRATNTQCNKVTLASKSMKESLNQWWFAIANDINPTAHVELCNRILTRIFLYLSNRWGFSTFIYASLLYFKSHTQSWVWFER